MPQQMLKVVISQDVRVNPTARHRVLLESDVGRVHQSTRMDVSGRAAYVNQTAHLVACPALNAHRLHRRTFTAASSPVAYANFQGGTATEDVARLQRDAFLRVHSARNAQKTRPGMSEAASNEAASAR